MSAWRRISAYVILWLGHNIRLEYVALGDNGEISYMGLFSSDSCVQIFITQAPVLQIKGFGVHWYHMYSTG